MNPGYISALLLLSAAILFATGWKPVIASNVRTRTIAVLSVILVAIAPWPLWWMPMPEHPEFRIHAAAIALLAAGVCGVWSAGHRGYRGYYLLCALMLALIWGSVRSLYSHDPMLHFLEPSWEAPLLCGLLCGAFTSDVKLQFGIAAWGIALGECIVYALQSSPQPVAIGDLSWLDGFTSALSIAILLGLSLQGVRSVAAKLGGLWMHMKGGRSS